MQKIKQLCSFTFLALLVAICLLVFFSCSGKVSGVVKSVVNDTVTLHSGIKFKVDSLPEVGAKVWFKPTRNKNIVNSKIIHE